MNQNDDNDLDDGDESMVSDSSITARMTRTRAVRASLPDLEEKVGWDSSEP